MGAGRPRIFQEPKDLWNAFQSYLDWAEKNPLVIEDYVGKDAVRVMREKPRAISMEGFSVWLFNNDVCSDVWQYFGNRDDAYTEFISICRAIKENIRTHQIEGGMAGIYNPSITQRLNGLVDKQENKIVTEQPLFPEE